MTLKVTPSCGCVFRDIEVCDGSESSCLRLAREHIARLERKRDRAIRAAENDALESAAETADLFSSGHYAAQAIRGLKHEDTP